MATPHHYNHWIFNKPNVISSAAPVSHRGCSKIIREFGIRKNKKKTWKKIGNLADVLYIYS